MGQAGQHELSQQVIPIGGSLGRFGQGLRRSQVTTTPNATACLPKSRNPNGVVRFLAAGQQPQSIVRNPTEALEPSGHAS